MAHLKQNCFGFKMKIEKVIPHIPYYMANGNKVIRTFEQPFSDRNGNEATITIVEYTDKKGKMHDAVIRVKWNSIEKMFAYTDKLYK
jgi:hypothetical protein